MDLDLHFDPGAPGSAATKHALQRTPSPALGAAPAAAKAAGEALAVLEAESAGLRLLTRKLAGEGLASLRAAIRLLAACAGRVVVTGVGKCGIIGRALASTLAATGTPAHFVHPAEASHGDLGMITAGDAVIALAHSGDTPELADIIAHAKRFRLPLVAIAGCATSLVAREADVLLLLPDASEARLPARAPTTSTVLMLALGDALAIALLRTRQTAAGEARPASGGGAPGHPLVRVGDVMDGGEDLPLVQAEATMGDVILAMTRTRCACAGVIDAHGLLVGMISESEMRRHMGSGLLSRRAGEIMSGPVVTIAPDATANDALRLMQKLGRRAVIVAAGARPIGVLRIDDCRRAQAA